MEYIMCCAIVAVVAILVMLVVTCMSIRKLFKVFSGQDQVIELKSAQYEALMKAHERDVATAEFLYELLMDLVTPVYDETIIYKARTIQVILMIIDFKGDLKSKDMDYIRRVLNTPTLKHVDEAVHQILSDNKGTEVLEDKTVNAYERFMKLIDEIAEEECKACEKLQQMQDSLNTKLTPEELNLLNMVRSPEHGEIRYESDTKPLEDVPVDQECLD